MTPKKCMSIAKSLTNTQRMELKPLCSALDLSFFEHGVRVLHAYTPNDRNAPSRKISPY